MKKQVALAVAAALSLSVAGTALAAPANPFIDVPANHWAYDALAQLQQGGVVSGYGDGTFRGDRTLTRYEMAAMIAKISMTDDKYAPLIKRLQSEFASELYNLGVRVDKLEKNASTIKFTGDARIRYQHGGNVDRDGDNNRSRFQERVRINMTAQVNDNIMFYGRLRVDNDSNNRLAAPDSQASSETRHLFFDRAEFAWKNGNWGVSAGRMLPKLGQGIFAWNDRADGAIVSYGDGKFSALVGVLDITNASSPTNHWGTSVNATVAQLGYQFNKVGLTAMYANAHNDAYETVKPWAIGANIDLAKDWNLRGEYIHNTGEAVYVDGEELSKKGYFARLTYGAAKMSTPGSFEAYAEYLKFGANSAAIAGNGSYFDPFNLSANMKGWGIGMTYVLGKNHNLQLAYHDLKDDHNSDVKYKKQYLIATNFAF